MNNETKHRYFMARLERVFPNITKHKAFCFKITQRGDYRDFTFGSRWTSEANDKLEVMFHGIAHIIEFGGNKFSQRANAEYGFDFIQPTVYLGGHLYTQFTTQSASNRELRTWAIEIALLKQAGIKKSLEQMARERVSGIEFLPDYYIAFFNKNIKRKAKKKGIKLHTKAFERFVFDYYARKVVKLANKVNISQCEKELCLWLDNTEKYLLNFNSKK